MEGKLLKLSHVAQSLTPSPIQELSRVAERRGAINLAEGFPDFPAPPEIKEAAIVAITSDLNQYRHVQGICDCLKKMMKEKHALDMDPLTDVLICFGQTEAFAAAIFATINRGDEALLFDPAYETYESCIAMAGGIPVLPRKMLDFLDAPVPFIVGIQHKPVDLKIKTPFLSELMCTMIRELFAELSPVYAILSCENSIAKRHPAYKCNEVQVEAAERFLSIMRRYMESICSNLRSHTITSVQSNNYRVSLLLEQSYIDSFPTRNRPFIKLFVDTQLFPVLSDSKLSSFENEQFEG